MKLRIAKKIINAVANGSTVYSESQIEKALSIVERTQSSKRAHAYWNHLVTEQLTVEDRAAILPPQMAFRLLMRHDERDWDKTIKQLSSS